MENIFMKCTTIINAVVPNEDFHVLFLKIVELQANHEARKQDLEDNHIEQLQCVKQQYEVSLEGRHTVLFTICHFSYFIFIQ